MQQAEQLNVLCVLVSSTATVTAKAFSSTSDGPAPVKRGTKAAGPAANRRVLLDLGVERQPEPEGSSVLQHHQASADADGWCHQCRVSPMWSCAIEPYVGLPFDRLPPKCSQVVKRYASARVHVLVRLEACVESVTRQPLAWPPRGL